ncbi:MAG: dienelactone hydrolase family protein [Candidatus Methylomirabilia bacterium]
MLRGIIAGALAVLCSVSSAASGENVTFAGKTTSDNPLTLTGILAKADGDGPFPAVVLLHGCSGIRPLYRAWVARLVVWGYVALQVDSFNPRGKTYICDKLLAISSFERAKDAHAAKAYLAGLPFVRGDRIAVLGWSHGGSATLEAVNNPPSVERWADPFRVAVAFYPWCWSAIHRPDAPLLILIGERDDWTPAGLCRNMRVKGETLHSVSLKVYPGAHHGFDFEGLNLDREGHHLEHDPVASTDAIKRVKDFLAQHLR